VRGYRVLVGKSEIEDRMMGMRWSLFTLVVLAIELMIGTHGLKVDMTATKDQRRWFAVEQFGLLEGGYLRIRISNFAFDDADGSKTAKAGFIVYQAVNERGVLEAIHEEIKEEYAVASSGMRQCPLDTINYFRKIEFEASQDGPGEAEVEATIGPLEEGLYDITFVRCGPDGAVSFKLNSEMYNKGPNYLTAGDIPSPWILFVFSLVFGTMLIAWIRYIKRNREHVHKVHHMMTAILVLKALAVFANALDFHYKKVYGYSITWNFLYHMLRSVRAVMLFVVIVMIGTGWSLLKPALNQWEKRFLLAALSLQVLANISLWVADELVSGSSAMMKWQNVFQMVDLICCVAVTLPIYFHIQELEKRTSIGGKVRVNLAKLKQFRKFYLLVFVYLYFTRIIVYLVENAVDFRKLYIGHILRELAAVGFYLTIAYIFRPTGQSAYLKVPTKEGHYEEDDEDEYLNEVSAGGTHLSTDDEDPFNEDYFFNQDVEMPRLMSKDGSGNQHHKTKSKGEVQNI